MKTYIKQYGEFGDLLFIENGDVVLGVPLNFGLRISYLSYKGSDNLMFEHPSNSTKFTTDNGWRLYGGHRLWIAPEGDESYYPDNEPISYTVYDDKVVFTQKRDPWIDVIKSFEISFTKDGLVKIEHKITNVADKVKRFAPWSVTTLAGGGVEFIPLKEPTSTYTPKYRLSMWRNAFLNDSRLEFLNNGIRITHEENREPCKIGVGHPDKSVTYTNKGVIFEKIINVIENATYPDGDVSFETYLIGEFAELETLAPLSDVEPNKTVCHTETWRLTKK